MKHATLLFSCLASILTSGLLLAGEPRPAGDTPRRDVFTPARGGTIAGLSDPRNETEALLWWLPEDTEAVVISKGRIPIGNNPTRSIVPLPYVQPPYRFEDVVAMCCIAPLAHPSALYQGTAWTRLVKRFYGPGTAVLFAKALRRTDTGGPETCDIVLFRDDTPGQILYELGRLRSVARKIGSVSILDVELNNRPFNYTDEAGPDHRYLASPQRGVFVAATSDRLLTTVIDRVKHRGQRRALPAELSEWRQIDLAAPAWAIRHYQAAGAEKDRTCMRKFDAGAKGLVLFCGSGPPPFVAMRYVSTSPDAGQRFIHMRAQALDYPADAEKSVSPLVRVNADAVEERYRINASTDDALRHAKSLSVEATAASELTFLPNFGFRLKDL